MQIRLRFLYKAYDSYFDVEFDDNLSFNENFALLDYLDVTKVIIYDEQLKVALAKTIPLKSYNFKEFYSLSIY